MNRATTYIKVRAYKSAIDDLNTAINILEKDK